MDDLSVKQMLSALTHRIRREVDRFEADTGKRVESISIGRVHESVSSVDIKLENRYGTG